LGCKAKQEPKFRFYALYDRINRAEPLETAWCMVAADRGVPGIGGVSIEMIQEAKGGPEKLVAELQEELRTRRDKPEPVLWVYIEKDNGKSWNQ
jgi:RNA-directed DNA polymerase